MSYQMLVKQQLNSSNTSPEKVITKTQLAVNIRPTNTYISKQQSKDNCCNTV